jgi:hypothetical protein
MTKEECAIVSAYTGFLCGEFSWMHQYAEKLINTPITTLQFGDADFVAELKQKAKPDFVKLHCIKQDESQHAKDLAMVKQDGEDLRHVKVQTLEIWLAAVNRNGYALEHVKEQTDEICLAAVNQNGNALLFVEEQTEEICIAAVKQDGYALEYVDEQFQEVCKEYLANNS